MKMLNQIPMPRFLLILITIFFVACGGSNNEPASSQESINRDYPAPDNSLSSESRTVDSSYPKPDQTAAEGEGAIIGSMVVEEIESDDDQSMEVGAGDADVIFVEATLTGENLWRFNVTVEHLDTGWEDYADGWDVVTPDGTVLKVDSDDVFTRLLAHPHENEQPFTRSQSNVPVPVDVTTVIVRAHDLVDGFGGQEVVIDLSQSEGTNFTVTR